VNDGRGRLRRDPAAVPAEAASGSCVVGADYDRDGDLDLFVCGRVVPGRYPLPARSYLLRNDTRPGGPPRFADVRPPWRRRSCARARLGGAVDRLRPATAWSTCCSPASGCR
jgi:hypothetical protein